LAEKKASKSGKLKILFVSSEVVPFAKTGGLADVAGALPKALRKAGHDARVVMPAYKCIDKNKFRIRDTGLKVDVDIALFNHEASIKEALYPDADMPVYFVGNHEFFDRDELYRTPQGEYPDNAERYIFFCRSVMEMIKIMDFQPDIIHCNDWHTGLIPVYLKTLYAENEFYKNIRTVYSIHNISYQGNFDIEKLSHSGLPMSLFNPEELEFYGRVNFMKGGIVFSDAVSTVSGRYRDEIETPEFGCGLEGVLKAKDGKVHGILNGIDYDIWDPGKDRYIYAKYDSAFTAPKEEVKKKLLEESGLKYYENVPLAGIVSRLDSQKGLDFIAAVIDEMMKMNLQFIVLGTGEEHYHRMLLDHAAAFPEKMAVHIKFDNKHAHNIYAGSDIFLMPSHFEPCGLGQLISLKYGTIPVVRETGGLADTVIQYNFKTKQGNGFVFSGSDPMDFLRAIRVAVDTYKNKTAWKKIRQNGMKLDFSWEIAAKKYTELYESLIVKN